MAIKRRASRRQPSPEPEVAEAASKARRQFKIKDSEQATSSDNVTKVTPQVAENAKVAALLGLLKTEEQARDCKTDSELIFLAANETRKHIKARQIFVVQCSQAKRIKVAGVTTLDAVDRNTPMIRWIERMLGKVGKENGLAEGVGFVTSDYRGKHDADEATYPFKNMFWVPFKTVEGKVFGGMLAARENPWVDADKGIASRLGKTYAHAWLGLRGDKNLVKKRIWPKLFGGVGLICLIAAGFLPVPLTVLAPVEVTPRGALVVAAPFDGVVDSIMIEPNSPVRPGDLLVQLEDVSLRNSLELAEREVGVSESKLQQLYQAAFGDQEARQELRTAVTELKVRTAERDYAQELLSKSQITADKAGVAVFTDKKEWAGRPVSTGMRIMQVADPAKFEFTVELPVNDSIVLEAGARAKIFLDSDPLNSLETTIVQANYEAQITPSDVLAYKVTTSLPADDQQLVRLGARGTAQLYGATVPLYFYLFRKPLSFVRQKFGL